MNENKYLVNIDNFEGPLDVLLHLIKEKKFDLLDLPIAKITEQYLLYLKSMEQMHLEIASEYLVMAAYLIETKSKMLLPKQEVIIDDEGYIEDPREELIQQLIEYKKYKEIAGELKELESDRQQYLTKSPSDIGMYIEDMVLPSQDFEVYDLIKAMQKMLQRKELLKPLETKIAKSDISIEQRAQEVWEFLRNKKGKVAFENLFEYGNRDYLVATFLAILDLAKQKVIMIEQNNNFANIFVELIDKEV